MSDDDLIRRGDALKLMQLAIDVYGQNMRGAADKKEKRDWQSMLIAAVDIRYAIKAIPAAQVAVKPLEWAHEVKMPSGNLEVRTQNDGRMEFFTHCGIYTIRDRGTNGSPMYMLRRLGAPIMGSAVLSDLYTAAQADYDASIQSALTAQPSPDVEALVEALEKLVHAVCGETGFAQSVRNCSGFAYPWPALDEAELIASAALARVKGGDA